MPEEEILPNPKISFYLKNILMLIKLKRSNKKRIEKFVYNAPLLKEPLIPKSEGNFGPMEEGMIYVMFNSEGETLPQAIDSVFRFFWVDSPDLRISIIYSFLVSEKFKSERWGKSYPRGMLKNQTKERYHQEVFEEEAEMFIDGTWEEGYIFNFLDKKIGISAKLKYEPLNPKSVLVYYNGKLAVTPSLAQKFYDMFAFKVKGEIEVRGEVIKLEDARGIIEHGVGIFSTLNIYDWRWLNLQFPNGAIHIFYHSLDLEEEVIIEGGEGALVLDGKWFHFQRGDFQVEEVEYSEDENIPSKVATEWRVTGGKDVIGKPLLDLKVTTTAKISWSGVHGKENLKITNYVLEAEGTWRSKKIKGKGTMENLMHRTIE